MRPIWKGSISFGLVNVPIALYSATRHEELRFRLLRARDLSPINYKRVAEVDGKEVPWDQIVKGYEYEDGKYVVLKDEDFKRVDLEATQTVDIIDFVKLEEIDPIFFAKPVYMVPTKGGEKAYVVLREALKDTEKVGIAKVVIKTRQHLAAVKSKGNALVLELMHFAEELVDPGQLTIPAKLEVRPKEKDMAKKLIETMTEKWHPEKYDDDYREALLKVIHAKIRSGGKEIPEPHRKAAKATNVIDLVSVLQKSIAHNRGAAGKKATKAKKTATKRASA